MFDSLKSRFRKKDYDDLGDIRSNVLGNSFTRAPEPDFPPAPPQPRRGFDDFSPTPRRSAGPGFDDDLPPGFSNIDTRAPQQQTKDYDLMDRLSLIESQLSAIRSQTETINERLKNLEAKLTRRY